MQFVDYHIDLKACIKLFLNSKNVASIKIRVISANSKLYLRRLTINA